MAKASLKNILNLIDEAKKEIPVEQSFLNDLKRSIEISDMKNRDKPSQTYKPSSLQCIRNMYYQVTGAEETDISNNSVLIGICNSGSDIHERIQTAVSEMIENNIDCEYIDVSDYIKSNELDIKNSLQVVEKCGHETKLRDTNLNMSFLADGIIKYKDKYYVLEIKTESMYKWQSRKYVADEHLMQATAYANAFNLNTVIFLYISRDNLDMKCYKLDVTEDMKYDLITKIEECDEYVKKGEVPPIPANVPKKACTYCNYRKKCNSEG